MLSVFAFNAVHTRFFKADITFEEPMQLPNTSRVAHFAKRFSFNLSYALSSYFKLATDFLECPGVTVCQAKAK